MVNHNKTMDFLLLSDVKLEKGFYKYSNNDYYIIIDPYHLISQLRYCVMEVISKNKFVSLVNINQKEDIMCIAYNRIYTKSITVIDSCLLIDYIKEHYKSLIDMTLDELYETRYDICKSIMLYAVKYDLYNVICYLINHKLFFSKCNSCESYDYVIHVAKTKDNQKIYNLLCTIKND